METNPSGTATPGGNGTGKNIIITILVLLVIVMGAKIYLDAQAQDSLEQELATTTEDLTGTRARLEEIKAELDQKIEEISKLGGDIESLKKAKEEVEATLKKNKAWSAKNIKELKERVEGYEKLLKMKDQELEELKSLNSALYSENNELKSSQNRLSDSLSRVARRRDELAGKVAIASQLRAENIRLVALTGSSREKESPFRSRQLTKLKLTFNLADNKVAPIEGKKIMYRIVTENGQVIFDLAKGSGTFILDGREEWYTGSREILFDNTRQELSFQYEKGSDYAEGNYTVELFADNYRIGSASFVVK